MAPALNLAAIHIDHGLHPRSRDWAEHCRDLCARLGVHYQERRASIRMRPGESLEAAARAERYRLLAEYLAPGEQLATAQHRDDQAETLLLALLRGSGVHGLAAMAPSAPLGAGTLIRPLLELGRQELQEYARAHGLAWVEDPSNQDLRRDRNRLRLEILPLLRERWPAASVTLARAAEQAAEAAALIDGLADERLPAIRGSRPGSLSVARLAALDRMQAKALIRRWLMSQGFRPPSSARLQAVFSDLLPARADAVPMVAWEGCELRRYRDDLFALDPLPPVPTGDRSWDGAGRLQLPSRLGWLSIAGVSPLSPGPSAGIARPMTLSFDRHGLRCRRCNQPSRRLKQLFQAADIPPWLRPYIPLLLDADGELLAVAGVARCGAATGHEPPWAALSLCWSDHPWMRFGWLADRL
jgi:tRNA(Ile)-lysidine synthase